MKPALIAGLTNVETNLQIPGFPLEYNPVNFPFFGVQTHTSGVGVNLSLALQALGVPTRYLSLLAKDSLGDFSRREMEEQGLDCRWIPSLLKETPASVILREESGRRQIHCDLKDIQETVYPLDLFHRALEGVDLCILTPINFARPLLGLSRQAGRRVATDLHVLSDARDEYHRDFLENAHILFLSNEGILEREEDFVRELAALYPFETAVVGLGGQGSLLWERRQGHQGDFSRVGVHSPRPLVNTIGAGDALFSAFLFWTGLPGLPAGRWVKTARPRALPRRPRWRPPLPAEGGAIPPQFPISSRR